MSTDKITVERKPKSRVVCTVKIDEAEYGPAEAQALQNFSQQIEIKGFRPGHAPPDMIRSKVPPEQLFEEAVRILLRSILPALLTDHKIAPVIAPKVEVASRLPLVLTITFVERPQVTVKNIDKLSVPKKEAKADPKDVQRVLDSVLQEHRTLKEVDRAAKTGDQITMDFRSTDDKGTEIQGMNATAYTVTIGSAQLLPGFEDQLAGLKKGENKTFTLTLPEKFQSENLRGKPATFHVTVTKVEEVTLPELNDAFAKEKLQSESAQAFKDMIVKSIEDQEVQFANMGRERELMEEIRKRTSGDIAEELIEEEVRGMIDEWAQRLESQGISIADQLKKEGKKPEDVEKEMRQQAEERWKLRLGIGKIIEEKQISVTPEELEEAFGRFSMQLNEEQKKQAREEWDKRAPLYDEVRWRTLVDKMIEMLLA
jgi:trigger factor